MAGLIFCLVGWIYSPVLAFDFVHWDDPHNVTGNPLLLKPWSWELFVSCFWGPDSSMRFKPLHWLLYRGWNTLFGFDPSAWHFLGLFFHALAAALTFCVFNSFYSLSFSHLKTRAPGLVALLCALLWALHPLRVEPVAWVTGSAYPFTTCFLLGMVLFYLKHAKSESARPKVFFLTASWLCGLAAFSSYSISLTAPLLLIALDVGILRLAPDRWWDLRDKETFKWWGKHMLFVVPALTALAVTLATKTLPQAGFPRPPAFSDYTLGERTMTGLASLGWFPFKLLLPFDLTPNLKPMLYREGWDPLALRLMIASACAFLCLWLRRKRHPSLWWFTCGFIGFSLPCLGLSEFPIWPPDRYSYALDLVLIGGVGALWLSWGRSWEKRTARLPALGAMAALILVVAIRSSMLLPTWQNTDTLFTHIEQHPDFQLNPAQQGIVYGNWARYAAGNNDTEQATRHVSKAVQAYLSGIVRRIKDRDLDGAAYLVREQHLNLGFCSLQSYPPAWWSDQLGMGAPATYKPELSISPVENDLRFLEILYDTVDPRRP